MTQIMVSTHWWGAAQRIGEQTKLLSRLNEPFGNVPVFQASQKKDRISAWCYGQSGNERLKFK